MTTQKFDEAEVSAALGGSATYLGTGSFGETWCVNGEAVKIIHTDSGARLRREVDGLNRVVHPNVVRLIREGSAHIGGQDRITLHFEFIAGEDVATQIRSGSLLPAGEVHPFLLGLMSGISALHAQQVIHRDINPANVSLRAGDWRQPVILDLGLAKLLDMSSVTNYPALVGTAPYMSPEQLGASRVRKATDVFSCGVLAYEAVTGTHPFRPAPVTTIADLLQAIALGADPDRLDHLEAADRHLIMQALNYQEHARGSARSIVGTLEGRQ